MAQYSGPPCLPLGVGGVGRHHQVIFGYLRIQCADAGVESAHIILGTVHLEDLPHAEDGEQYHDDRGHLHRSLLDVVESGSPDHFGGQQIELLHRRIGLGEGQAYRRREYGTDLGCLIGREVDLGDVQAGQGGDRVDGQMDLGAQHGNEAVE